MNPPKSSLRVRYGVAEDKLIDLLPNDDKNPGYVNSDHFTGFVSLRLAKPEVPIVADGTTVPTTDYFKSKSRMFSFQFMGRFKPTNSNHPKGYWTADDVQYVVQFDGPIKKSRSVSLVTKLVMMIDPSMELQYIHQETRPFVASYVFTACNTLSGHRVDPAVSAPGANAPKDQSKISTTDSPPLDPGPWVYSGETELTETLDVLAPKVLENESGSSKKLVTRRRNHFNVPENRKSLELHPDLVIGCDLYNPNFNPASAQLEMSSRLKVDVTSVINNQPLRWVVRAKDRPDAVFFVLEVDYKADTR